MLRARGTMLTQAARRVSTKLRASRWDSSSPAHVVSTMILSVMRKKGKSFGLQCYYYVAELTSHESLVCPNSLHRCVSGDRGVCRCDSARAPRGTRSISKGSANQGVREPQCHAGSRDRTQTGAYQAALG